MGMSRSKLWCNFKIVYTYARITPYMNTCILKKTPFSFGLIHIQNKCIHMWVYLEISVYRLMR